jgi:hypothetical protein
VRDINAIQTWEALAEDWHLSPPDTSKEDQKERDWAFLEGEARDFVKKWGAAAMLRCVSDALKEE